MDRGENRTQESRLPQPPGSWPPELGAEPCSSQEEAQGSLSRQGPLQASLLPGALHRNDCPQPVLPASETPSSGWSGTACLDPSHCWTQEEPPGRGAQARFREDSPPPALASLPQPPLPQPPIPATQQSSSHRLASARWQLGGLSPGAIAGAQLSSVSASCSALHGWLPALPLSCFVPRMAQVALPLTLPAPPQGQARPLSCTGREQRRGV